MYEELEIASSVKKQFDLTGCKVAITGGAGFLGVQFAEAIAEMGGIPILLDFNQELLQKAGERLKASGFTEHKLYEIDITDEANCKDVVGQIINELSRIDVLINSAALTKAGIEDSNADFFAPFEDTDQNLWDAGFKVNLTGTQIMCKLIGSLMLEQRKGSIINIASDVGVISPDQRIYQPDGNGYKGVPFNSPAFYAVSKAGVIHLSKFLATYWAQYNVRVNSISPAGVYRNHEPGFVEKLSAKIPMGRMAQPNEFKGAIAFLASDASSFVTGHNLVIDGGRTVW